MSAFEPTPPTIVVVSLFTLTVWALPSISSWTSFRSKPNSVDTNLPPVRMARSSSMAFLLSPKAGAFTATTSNVPLSLLTTSVDRASPSRSSAMISSLPPCWTSSSSRGSISWIFDIFLSVIRMYGFSRTASIFSTSFTM